jgi:pimeloyl-ACP methyl ester carboxylesterase
MANTNENRYFLANRFGMQIAVYVTEPKGTVIGTAVMVHGLSSSSNRPIFTQTTPTFTEAGYRVVRYDATHSLGASAGDPGLCTMTSILHDMEDVLVWITNGKLQPAGKLILMGHSLGAMAIGLTQADARVFVSAVTDGTKSFDYSWVNDEIIEWQNQGFVERGRDKGFHRLRWSHYNDRCAYTILGNGYPNSLLISGTEDSDRPGTDDLEQSLIETNSSYGRLDLEGAAHSIYDDEHIEQVNAAIADFLLRV